MKLYTTFIVILFGLAGCTPSKVGAFKTARNMSDSTVIEPGRLFMRGLPQSNDSYSQGVRDGCETYMGIVGAGVLRFIPAKIDGFRLSEDPAYARGFMDGGTYCTFYLDWDIQ